MFSSVFGSSASSTAASGSASASASASAAGEVHPPKERLSSPDATFGPLNAQDTAWLCAGGFTTETQTFYAMTPGKNAKLLMVQVIHSAVGMWYPQIQFTFRLYDPATGKNEWRSTNVTNFVTAPSTGSAKHDKRSCKSDQFSILVDPAHPDTYTIEGNYDANTQVSLKFKRADGAPGFKLGSGPKGGMTYFGAEKANAGPKDRDTPDVSSGTDGYVIHRFWPRCMVSGIVRTGSEVLSLDSGARGIFIHAIQGMRPNLVASRWNFGYFNSTDEKEGVSLVMMEFTTTSSYGSKVINIGSVVVDDQLVAVVSDGTVQHLDTTPVDADTGYAAPGKMQFNWKNGRSLLPSMGAQSSENNKVSADVLLDISTNEPAQAGKPRSFSGLIEKVDVLAQIPYLVKKVISYVAGTKPYIYTFHKEVTANISLPSSDGSEVRKLSVQGYQFTEATFISE